MKLRVFLFVFLHDCISRDGEKYSMNQFEDDPKWQRERRRKKYEHERQKREYEEDDEEDRKARKQHRRKRRDKDTSAEIKSRLFFCIIICLFIHIGAHDKHRFGMVFDKLMDSEHFRRTLRP